MAGKRTQAFSATPDPAPRKHPRPWDVVGEPIPRKRLLPDGAMGDAEASDDQSWLPFDGQPESEREQASASTEEERRLSRKRPYPYGDLVVRTSGLDINGCSPTSEFLSLVGKSPRIRTECADGEDEPTREEDGVVEPSGRLQERYTVEEGARTILSHVCLASTLMKEIKAMAQYLLQVDRHGGKGQGGSIVDVEIASTKVGIAGLVHRIGRILREGVEQVAGATNPHPEHTYME